MRIVTYIIIVLFILSPVTEAKQINVPKDFQTIQQAIEKANSGDIILLAEGDYNEALELKKDNIAIEGVSRDKVKIIADVSKKTILYLDGVENFQLSGITFKSNPTKVNSKDKGKAIGAVDVNNSKNIRLKNCSFFDVNTGIKFVDSHGEIDNCKIDRTNKAAVVASGKKTKLKITNCYMTSNKGGALNVVLGAKCFAEKITFKQNKTGVLCLGQESELEINNSVFESNLQGLVVAQGAKSSAKKCTFTKNIRLAIYSQDKGSQVKAEQCNILDTRACGFNIINGSYGVIKSCKISNNRKDIIVGDGASAEISDCSVSGNTDKGINVHGKSKVVTITKNTISGKYNYGIYVTERSQANISENIIKSAKTGIRITNYSTADISKNKLVSNDNAISCSPKSNITTDSNTFEKNEDFCFVQLNEYVLKGKFDLLESIASDLKQKKSKVDASSVIIKFYKEMNQYFDFTDSEKTTELEKCYDKWITEKPGSTTAFVSKASMHIRHAWDARGGSYTGTVSDEGWKIFKAELNKADELLSKADKLKIDDKVLYHKWLKVSCELGRSRQEAEACFKKVLSIDPDCLEVYSRMAFFLLPRWHGRTGDYERFAMSIRQYPETLKGDAIYALMAGSLLRKVKKAEFLEMGFSYDRIRDGYKAYHKLYPNDKLAFSKIALIAYWHGDIKTVSDSFESIDDECIATFWKPKTLFYKIRKEALGYRKSKGKLK
ncbi:MAG: hypothetical protein FVQ82_11460 [Planctomycetes bacterium]|nr:hypothetical protein [Planctomycetota bacterium]